MVSSPTTGARESSSAWAGRPVVAHALRAVVYAIPVVASWSITRLLASTYWRPAGAAGLAVWAAQMLVVGSTVVLLAGRAARRLLPLAALFNLSLAFPDQAPSRFRVALRSGTIRNLEAQLADIRAHGYGDSEAAAASRVLELVAALSTHERMTRGHTERVRAYTDMIAVEMGLGEDEREMLRWAAMLHDIGKLAVPAEILNKPGRPTEEEWAILASHPVVGGELVEPLAEWLGPWRLAASEHHERWDGTGYPARLAGAQISLAGRIVAVADAYDVITSARTYKKPMTAVAARQELVRCSGTQFDPAVVRAFLAVSIGARAARVGALGWGAEVVRSVAVAAAQGTSTATTLVAATAMASATAMGAASVPLGLPQELALAVETPATSVATAPAPPPDEPEPPVVVAKRAAGGDAGVQRSVAQVATPTDPDDARAATGPGADAAPTTTTTAPPPGVTTTTVPPTTSTVSVRPAAPTTTTAAAPAVRPPTTTGAPAAAPGGSGAGAPATTSTTIAARRRAPAPSPPVATADSATVAVRRSVSIDVLANDRDPDGDLDPTTLRVRSAPRKGSATVRDGVIRYTATSSGTDRFTYEICDAGGRCATAEVTVRRP